MYMGKGGRKRASTHGSREDDDTISAVFEEFLDEEFGDVACAGDGYGGSIVWGCHAGKLSFYQVV